LGAGIVLGAAVALSTAAGVLFSLGGVEAALAAGGYSHETNTCDKNAMVSSKAGIRTINLFFIATEELHFNNLKKRKPAAFVVVKQLKKLQANMIFYGAKILILSNLFPYIFENQDAKPVLFVQKSRGPLF
jgi:hypothetical protein